MTLFSSAEDPHSHRVRIVLAAKGLEVRVDIGEHGEWLPVATECH